MSSPFIRVTVGSSVGDVVHWQALLQPNAFDCGVYTLRFLQVFVESVDKGLFQVLNSEFAEGQDRPAAQTPNTKSCRSLYLPVATHPTIEIIV